MERGGVRHPILKPTKVEIFLNNQFIHPTIVFRKRMLNALGGYTVSKATRRGQDYDLWCKLTSAGYIGENLSDVLYIIVRIKTHFQRENGSIELIM